MANSDVESLSEETPLLQTAVGKQHEEVYKRFSPAQKKAIVTMVSLCGMLPLFVTGTFVPSIPQIAKEFDSTPGIVSLAVSLSVSATSIGSLIGATYSSFYGRRVLYVVGGPILFFASVGVTLSRTIPQLLFWRFMQSISVSPNMTIGAAVIGDIYKLEERGTGMGIFLAGILVGPAIAPFAGGLAAHYSSWRLLQFGIGLFSLVLFIFVLFFFPETYHPGERGVDKMEPGSHPKWRPIWINPLRPLWLLRSPNLTFVSFAGFTAILTDYVMLIPISYTIGERYGIKNEAIIGACFLPNGIGYMLGATFSGRWSDKVVIRWKAKRGGEWVAEDRLRATLPGALFIVPLSILGCGLVMEYIPGPLGLGLVLVCFFTSAIGVNNVLSPSSAYCVDSLHSRSAEAMAAYTGFRQLWTALSISAIFPMVEKYGVLRTNTFAAIFSWIGCGVLLITIRYGARLRALVDVGFSTAQNN